MYRIEIIGSDSSIWSASFERTYFHRLVSSELWPAGSLNRRSKCGRHCSSSSEALGLAVITLNGFFGRRSYGRRERVVDAGLPVRRRLWPP